MRQIPGDLYDLNDGVITITEEEGDRWHLIQTLAGDQTDGYSGVPGYGVKKAEALFDKQGYSWNTVVEAFAEKGLGEDVALQNARLARILRCKDYDFTAKQPILWSPSSSVGIDNGAAVQDASD
jgi:DNA polymerase-1